MNFSFESFLEVKESLIDAGVDVTLVDAEVDEALTEAALVFDSCLEINFGMGLLLLELTGFSVANFDLT